MNSSKKKVFSFYFLLHIYFQSLFLKYDCFFSQKDIYLNIEDSLNLSKWIFYRYRPSTCILIYQTPSTSHLDLKEWIRLSVVCVCGGFFYMSYLNLFGPSRPYCNVILQWAGPTVSSVFLVFSLLLYL